MQLAQFISLFSSGLLWRVKTKSKEIYLTFDDGPVPDVTETVLDILDDYNWKATFFCVGENVKKYPKIYEELLKRGHSVGNHSFNHLRGFRTSLNDYVANVKKASKYIDSRLFRPPHGRITPSQIKVLKQDFDIVMWDLITYDYNKQKTAEQIMKIIKRNLRKGSIVVFHDSLKAKSNVLKVLPQAIEFWQSKGFTCAVL